MKFTGDVFKNIVIYSHSKKLDEEIFDIFAHFYKYFMKFLELFQV